MIMRCAELTQQLKIPTILINLELAAAYMIELINVRRISRFLEKQSFLTVANSLPVRPALQQRTGTNMLIA